MTIGNHMTSFGGLDIRPFSAIAGLPRDLAGLAFRVEIEDYDGDIHPLLDAFVNDPRAGSVEGLVVGEWAEMFDTGADEIYDKLAAAASKLPGLRVLFVPDVTGEQCEISWIQQGRVHHLLQAFPDLQVLGVRGGEGLVFHPIEHAHLTALVIESGGLPGRALSDIGKCRFPHLRKLELWLGDSNYGATSDLGLLSGILAGPGLPALEQLGLRNSEHSDAIAALVAKSRLGQRIGALDLSMGTLGDAGARALHGMTHLRRLDIHHNFISEAALNALKGALADTVVVGGEVKGNGDGDDRYVEVSE